MRRENSLVDLRNKNVFLRSSLSPEFEGILDSKKVNYWRDGVRVISETISSKPLAHAQIVDHSPRGPDLSGDFESEDAPEERKKGRRYTSVIPFAGIALFSHFMAVTP